MILDVNMSRWSVVNFEDDGVRRVSALACMRNRGFDLIPPRRGDCVVYSKSLHGPWALP